jgi:hypothetical protein
MRYWQGLRRRTFSQIQMNTGLPPGRASEFSGIVYNNAAARSRLQTIQSQRILHRQLQEAAQSGNIYVHKP